VAAPGGGNAATMPRDPFAITTKTATIIVKAMTSQ
jgi:hypothetical protein